MCHTGDVMAAGHVGTTMVQLTWRGTQRWMALVTVLRPMMTGGDVPEAYGVNNGASCQGKIVEEQFR